MKKLILLSVLATLCLFKSLHGQNNQPDLVRLTGTITDNKGNVLPGAIVRVRNHSSNTIADSQGRFAMTASLKQGILIASLTGYHSDTLAYDVTKAINYLITLRPLNLALQEVVVSTGYQTLNKERATGSFVQLDNQLINRRNGPDVLSRLEGVVPGLLFNRNTANSSRGQTDISIRGSSTLFSNNQPLVVIDGFPYEGDLNSLNPSDIESITVLKDAAAASIWGVRSGNGVIVLTTKRGRQDQKLQVQFNGNVTLGNTLDLYYNREFLNSDDYINIERQLFDRGFFNAQIAVPTQVISPVVQILADQRSGKITAAAANAAIDALRTVDTRDGLNKYFYQHSLQQQYNLNFRGGGEQSAYYFSVGEDHNRSNLTGNAANRFTLNGSYTFAPIRALKISLATNFIRSDQRSNGTVSDLNAGGQYTSDYLPYLQFADANGTSLSITKKYNQVFASGAEQQGFLNWQYRPLDELANVDNSLLSNDNRYNVNLNYQPIKGLSADLKYQYQYSSSQRANYYSTATFYTRDLINQFSQKNSSGVFTYPVPNGGVLSRADASLKAEQLRAQLNYNTTIHGQHQVNAIAGVEVNSRTERSSSNVAYGYNKDTETNTSQIDFLNFYNLNPNSSSGQIPNNQSFSRTTDHFLSYFGNAAYTYDRRYTFTVSGRIDKSNLFGVETNQKAVPLYSTGLGWNVDKESFYKVAWLPDLRIRVTYGYNANVNKAATAVTTLRQQSNAYFNGIPYNTIANPGNPELRWERARMINLAVDFGSRGRLLTGTFEYFFKRSTDLFGSSPLPPSTGLSSFYGNTASTKGHGFDLTLSSRNINGKQFKWTTDLLLSYVMDKVNRYDAPASVNSYLSTGSGNGGAITPMAGQPIFGIYSFRSGPLTHETGDPQGFLNGQLSTEYAKIIAATGLNDLYFNGPSRPTTFGSFRNTLGYRDWSISVNIIYKLNYYFRRSSTPLNYQAILYGRSNTDYTLRWQKPGDENETNVPSILYPPGDNNRTFFYQNSQALVDKGDHLRLQDIRLSYVYNKRVGGRTPFEQVQFFIYVNNVGILWRANPHRLDPDLFTSGIPLPTTFSLGTNLNF